MKLQKSRIFQHMTLLLMLLPTLTCADNNNNNDLTATLRALRTQLAQLTKALTTVAPWQQEWQALIAQFDQNEKAGQGHPAFDPVILLKVDGQNYPSLQTVQDRLKELNPQKVITGIGWCPFYIKPKFWHISLAYIRFLDVPEFEKALQEEGPQSTMEKLRIKNFAALFKDMLAHYTPKLKALTFRFNQLDTLVGEKGDLFIVAKFTPVLGITHVQQQFLLPFGQAMVKEMPRPSWFRFVKELKFHVTLAKIPKKCVYNFKFPKVQPNVADFKAADGWLEVSIQGPTIKKPLHEIVPWAAIEP